MATASRSAALERRDFDVVCVGGGGGGLAAAATAAEVGASVLVLEKRHTLGGNSSVATGMFAAESPAHERLNISAPSDELFRAAVQYAQWSVNVPLVRAFVDASAQTIAWLEGLGVVFEWITPLFPGQHPPTWHVPRGGGSTIVDALSRHAAEHGATIRTDVPVAGIARRQDGRFDVQVELDGKRELVDAATVVLATGGYGGNESMLRAHCPDFDPAAWFCSGLRHDGSGIRMGWELGAGRDGLGLCEFHAPSVQGPLFLSLALREASSLIVNADGDRFIDESIVDNPFEAANALRRQPGQTAFGLIDARLREAILEKAARKASGPLYEDQMNSVDQFRRLLDQLAGKRGAVVGSIGEAAAAIGCDPEHLTGVIQRYNASCAAGYDQDFGKHHRNLRALERPPFTVIRGTVGFFNTIGGLRVSSRLEAVDDRGRPIPGVYAAGVDVGGWQGSTYNFHLAGGSLGFAINSGRIAARHAVARLAG